jgi:hypothetical protein
MCAAGTLLCVCVFLYMCAAHYVCLLLVLCYYIHIYISGTLLLYTYIYMCCYVCASCSAMYALLCMCPHTAYIVYVCCWYSAVCVCLVPRDPPPHLHLYYCWLFTTAYVCPHTTKYVSSYLYICVLILLHTCPHATIYVSAYY